MLHYTDFTGYVLFIITSFLAGVESTDQCLLNSKVLSCFSGVILSIRSFFLLLGIKKINLIKRSSELYEFIDRVSIEIHEIHADLNDATHGFHL